MTKTKPKRAWKKKLLLVFLGLLFGLFMTEILLRVIGYSYPLFYVNDYDRGVALRPGAAGLYQREGSNYVSINSDGLRDREHARTKPAGTVRVALLGDSYAEALQVPIEQTFWWLLQQKLEACNAFPGKHVEIINFGVSGYGTAQELITLQQHVWEYSPDVVMLAVTTNNDISDNVRALKATNDIPYFVYRDGGLVRDDSFRESRGFRWRASAINHFGRWFRDHLRIIQLIDYVQLTAKLRISEWRNQRRAAKAPPQSAPAQIVPEITVDNMIYIEPRDELWKNAWHVTEDLIKEINDEVNQKGAKFFLVVGSNPIQVYPDVSVRQRFLQYIGTETLFYPNLRLKAFAEQQKIDFFDLSPPMQAYADQNRVVLHGFGSDLGNGHWNADGHKLVAELLARRICQAH